MSPKSPRLRVAGNTVNESLDDASNVKSIDYLPARRQAHRNQLQISSPIAPPQLPCNGPFVAEDTIMNRRSEARRVALQMLYLVDQNSEQDLHWIRTKIEHDLDNEQLADFAWSLFSLVRENQATIDEQIINVAKNWKIHRMAITDRNLLRLGVCEIQHLKSPIPVVLNECIELAKEFGTENSASFVNGLLDKLSSAADKSNA